MKFKFMLFALTGMMPLAMSAQETYQDTKFIDTDLNGTARYVGMGGAMEALGADLSTANTNPAATGLFRHGTVSASASLLMQGDAGDYADKSKTHLSFDHVGFVFSDKTSGGFVNYGASFTKSRNFNQILTAVGELSYASQNKLTARKYDYGVYLESLRSGSGDYIWNGVDAGYSELLPYSEELDKYGYYNSNSYSYGSYQHGYIGQYSMFLSGNIHDRWYLGVTFGIHDVHYKSQSDYSENIADVDGAKAYSGEDLKITGTGFDVKAGVIFRPVELSPFRIGLYVHTPTFYNLEMDGVSYVGLSGFPESGKLTDVRNGYAKNQYTYDKFKIYTPWKFGLSLGHTVGNYLALGATYEYADYSTIDNRITDGGYYDVWGDYYESSSSDHSMNEHTESTLKGVSTLKLGAEYKPVADVSLRVGYNYVSPIFREEGVRDGTVLSAGSANSTSTDYTNWKSTNRITLGVGYQFDKVSLDLSYQYSMQKGDFYPFGPYYEYEDHRASEENNLVGATEVKNNRSQLMLTVGYHF